MSIPKNHLLIDLSMGFMTRSDDFGRPAENCAPEGHSRAVPRLSAGNGGRSTANGLEGSP